MENEPQPQPDPPAPTVNADVPAPAPPVSDPPQPSATAIAYPEEEKYPKPDGEEVLLPDAELERKALQNTDQCCKKKHKRTKDQIVEDRKIIRQMMMKGKSQVEMAK